MRTRLQAQPVTVRASNNSVISTLNTCLRHRPNADPTLAEEEEAALRARYLMVATDDDEEDPLDLMLPDGKRRRSPVDYQVNSGFSRSRHPSTCASLTQARISAADVMVLCAAQKDTHTAQHLSPLSRCGGHIATTYLCSHHATVLTC